MNRQNYIVPDFLEKLRETKTYINSIELGQDILQAIASYVQSGKAISKRHINHTVGAYFNIEPYTAYKWAVSALNVITEEEFKKAGVLKSPLLELEIPQEDNYGLKPVNEGIFFAGLEPKTIIYHSKDVDVTKKFIMDHL